MKRYNLAILCLALFGITTIRAEVMSLPRDGDRFAWQRVEWQSPLQASPTAPDSLLLWDYSHAAELDRDREVRYVVVDDSIMARMETTYQATYLVRGDTVFDTGSESAHVSLRATPSAVKPRLGVAAGAPIAALRSMPLGATIHSPLEFTGLYCGQNATRSRGSQTVTVDAVGTLLLPTGDTIAGVTRVHTLRDATVELSRDRSHIDFDPSAQRHLRRRDDVYRLYAPGYPYPLLENVETTCYIGTDTRVDSVTLSDRRAYIFPPAAQEYALQRTDTLGTNTPSPLGGGRGRLQQPSAMIGLTSMTATMTGGTLTVNFAVGLNLDPGESVEEPGLGLAVSGEVGRDHGLIASAGEAWVEIVVSDLQGMVWASAPRRRCAVGDHTVTLDLSTLRPGRYLVAAFTPSTRLTDLIDR